MEPASNSSAPRRALVTGLGGFTGRYVAAELEAAGYQVIGLGPSSTEDGIVADLRNREAVLGALDGQVFDAVVHLAAISFVAHGDPDDIYQVNVLGTRHLLEALAAAPRAPQAVVVASSANVYGNTMADPLTEAVPPAPANDYAVSKLAMEYLARLWLDRLPIVLTRPFNYTGVGQSPKFLLPKIVDHVRRRAPVIELGNLDVERDFMDVRDVARLYRLLVEQAPQGRTFNLCSGQGHTLREVLTMAGDLGGHHPEVQVNPAFVRSNEVKRLVGTPTALQAVAPGFEPRPLRETLAWMLLEA